MSDSPWLPRRERRAPRPLRLSPIARGVLGVLGSVVVACGGVLLLTWVAPTLIWIWISLAIGILAIAVFALVRQVQGELVTAWFERANPGAAVMRMRGTTETNDAALELGAITGLGVNFWAVILPTELQLWPGRTDQPSLRVEYRHLVSVTINVLPQPIPARYRTPASVEFPAALDFGVQNEDEVITLPVVPVGGDDALDLLVLEMESRAELPWVDAS